jgi:hypothetical protein
MLSKIVMAAAVLLAPAAVYGQCYPNCGVSYGPVYGPPVYVGEPVRVSSTGDHYILKNNPLPERSRYYVDAQDYETKWKFKVPILNGYVPSVNAYTKGGWRVFELNYSKRITYNKSNHGTTVRYGFPSSKYGRGKAPAPKSYEDDGVRRDSDRGGYVPAPRLTPSTRKAPSPKAPSYDDELRFRDYGGEKAPAPAPSPRTRTLPKAPPVRTPELSRGVSASGSSAKSNDTEKLEERIKELEAMGKRLDEVQKLEARIKELEANAKGSGTPAIKVPAIKRPDDLLIRPGDYGQPEVETKPSYK